MDYNNLINSDIYNKDLSIVYNNFKDIDKIKNKSFLITGATGLIGSCLIDFLLKYNDVLNNKIYAVGRNLTKLSNRFPNKTDNLKFIQFDLSSNEVFTLDENQIDYVIYCASNTHPIAYATEPISTILTNVIGLNKILNFVSTIKNEKTIFMSSVEIYGENNKDVECFDENYLGYINCNTLRAGYPESKRVAESLCQAYIEEKKLDISILRLARIYGPTMQLNDSKALSQFIKKAIASEDIVLKSKGEQFYSYLYSLDVIYATLFALVNSVNGEAYNVGDHNSNIKLKDLANLIAKSNNVKVVFEIPNITEQKGYSTATKAILDNSKFKNLGWSPLFDLKESVSDTICILKEII